MYLILFLILFFIFILSYNFLFHKTIEGMEDGYVEYDTNNPNNALILSQQNAGNINVLEKQVTNLNGLNQQVQDLSGNVAGLQEQVNNLVSAQNQYASQMTPSTPPDISGTTSDTTDSTN